MNSEILRKVTVALESEEYTVGAEVVPVGHQAGGTMMIDPGLIPDADWGAWKNDAQVAMLVYGVLAAHGIRWFENLTYNGTGPKMVVFTFRYTRRA